MDEKAQSGTHDASVQPLNFIEIYFSRYVGLADASLRIRMAEQNLARIRQTEDRVMHTFLALAGHITPQSSTGNDCRRQTSRL